MKNEFTEIPFKNENNDQPDFDIVSLEDVLKKTPSNHSQFEFHKISFYAIILFTHGSGKYNINFKDYRFKKGSLFTVRKKNIHKFYKSNGKGTLLVFRENIILDHPYKSEASKIFMLFNEVLASPKIQLSKEAYSDIESLILKLKIEYSNINDEHSKVILRNILQIIFTKLFRLKSIGNPLFAYGKYLSLFLVYQKLVEKNCFKNRKVSFYAAKMDISSKTLNNVTQAVVNKSAKTFINDIFIFHAKKLIRNSSDPLIKISYKVGFDEPTNFFKYFRKHTGISPNEFRQLD